MWWACAASRRVVQGFAFRRRPRRCQGVGETLQRWPPSIACCASSTTRRFRSRSAEKLTVKDLDDVMALNFRAVLQCRRRCAGHARRQVRPHRQPGLRALLGREGRRLRRQQGGGPIDDALAGAGGGQDGIPPTASRRDRSRRRCSPRTTRTARRSAPVSPAPPMGRVGTTKEVAAACLFLSEMPASRPASRLRRPVGRPGADLSSTAALLPAADTGGCYLVDTDCGDQVVDAGLPSGNRGCATAGARGLDHIGSRSCC